MANFRKELLSIISCNKCGKIVEDERIYVRNNMFCADCASTKRAPKRVVKSHLWTKLCQCATELCLLGDNNNKSSEEIVTNDSALEDASAAQEEIPDVSNSALDCTITSEAPAENDFAKNDTDLMPAKEHSLTLIKEQDNLSDGLKLVKIKSNTSNLNIDTNAAQNSEETPNSLLHSQPYIDGSELDKGTKELHCNDNFSDVLKLLEVKSKPESESKTTLNSRQNLSEEAEETSNNQQNCELNDAELEKETEELKSNDNLIQNALKYFFKNGPGSLIIQHYSNDEISSLTPSNDSEIKGYDSVMQKELEQFFNSKKGRQMIKSVITEEVQNLIDRQIGVQEQSTHESTMMDGSVLADASDYESDNDIFVPPTPVINNKTLISSVMATGISLEMREIYKKFVQYFNLKMHESLFCDTECLISDQIHYTQKWLYSRCKGIPIVHSKWIIDCLKNGLILPTTNYLLEPSFEIPPLFKELDIILCPPFTELTEAEYSKLWSMAGARVSLTADWLPGPDHLKRLIIFDREALYVTPEEMKSMVIFHKAPAVSKSYLLVMLTYGTVESIGSHLYDFSDLNVKMAKRLGFPFNDQMQS